MKENPIPYPCDKCFRQPKCHCKSDHCDKFVRWFRVEWRLTVALFNNMKGENENERIRFSKNDR